MCVFCRSSKDAEEVAAKLGEEFNIKAKAYKCDVGDDKLVTETFKKIDDELGPVTGLVAVKLSLLMIICGDELTRFRMRVLVL